MSDAPGDFTLDQMSVRGNATVALRFANATQALHDRLLIVMMDELTTLEEFARLRMAELFNNPRRMMESLESQVVDSTTTITGNMIASGLPYLAIHEFGGVTSPHDIFPVNAKALRFVGNPSAVFKSGSAAGTDVVFTKHVSHPGSRMPERSYMRYALAQRRAAIRAAFLAAAAEVAGGETP